MSMAHQQQTFDAARVVYSLCLALERRDRDTFNQLRKAIPIEEWQAIAQQAINKLVEATRGQSNSLGASPDAYFESSIRALTALEALGAPSPETDES